MELSPYHVRLGGHAITYIAGVFYLVYVFGRSRGKHWGFLGVEVASPPQPLGFSCFHGGGNPTLEGCHKLSPLR